MQDNNYGKVAVLMGGNSSEREVSLLSGTCVLAALKSLNIDAHGFDPQHTALAELVKQQFNRAIIMLHGGDGEGGIIQGALTNLNIPYSGSGVLASALALNKYRCKLLWRNFAIPVASDQYLTYDDYQQDAFKLTLELPVIVKPASGGSTIGISKVYHMEQLERALKLGFKYDHAILIEQLIEGDEFSVPIVDGKVYPIVKIQAPNANYDYQHKYFSDDTTYICPCLLPDALQNKVVAAAKLAYQVIGASGITRLDFMIDRQERIYFLEINTIPGMTTHSLVPISFAACAIDYPQLCKMILDGTFKIVK